VHGLTIAGEGPTVEFDAHEFVPTAFAKLSGGGERLPWLDRTVAKKLADIGRRGFLFADKAPPGGFIMNLNYFRIDSGGHTQIRSTAFSITPGKTPLRITIRAQECPLGCPPWEVMWVGGGECYQRIAPSQEPIMGSKRREELMTVSWVRWLIRKAIETSPTLCAEPIDIVRLTAGRGAEWVDRGPECAGQ